MYECVGVGIGVYLTCFSVPVCLFFFSSEFGAKYERIYVC